MTFPNWSVARQDAAAPLLDVYIGIYGLPRSIIYGLVALESGFDPNAYRAEPQINDASRGLMQILYRTAQGLGYTGAPDGLFDPSTNIELGCRLFRQLLDRYGDIDQALSAYNTGRPTGSTAGQTYAAAVEARAAYFDALFGTTVDAVTDDAIDDTSQTNGAGDAGFLGGLALLLLIGVAAWRFLK